MGATRESTGTKCEGGGEHLARRGDLTLMLNRVDPERVDWDALDSFPDRNVYQTREWVSFTAKTQQAEPVLATVEEAGEMVGFFTGLIVRRYGIQILGSPFRGWTTGYLGFNLRAGVSRRAAVEAMLPFAFGRLGCMHIERSSATTTATARMMSRTLTVNQPPKTESFVFLPRG